MKKRFVLSMLAVIAVSVLALALVGCNTASSVDYAGKYPLSKVTRGDLSLEGSDLTASFPADKNYIEVKDSKNITFVLEGESISTTYSLDADGKTMHVNDNGTTLDFTLDTANKTISYLESSTMATMYFKKS